MGVVGLCAKKGGDYTSTRHGPGSRPGRQGPVGIRGLGSRTSSSNCSRGLCGPLPVGDRPGPLTSLPCSSWSTFLVTPTPVPSTPRPLRGPTRLSAPSGLPRCRLPVNPLPCRSRFDTTNFCSVISRVDQGSFGALPSLPSRSYLRSRARP